MAVVPICYKLPFKDQSILTLTGQNRKDFHFTKYSFYSTCNVPERKKRCLVCNAYKPKSVGKQLQSLDIYFKKLQSDDDKELSSVSSNKNIEFLEQGDLVNDEGGEGLLENYIATVNEDVEFVSFASSTSVNNHQGNLARGEWEKLKNHLNLKATDDSLASDLYLIGALISINIAVFLFEIASPVKNSELELFSLPSIYGAKINHLILLGEWWRLFTPMFLHSGIFHIGLGSWVLLTFGPQVCKAYGSFTFLLIYVLGGLSGNLTSFLQTPDPTVGGTGPVFAIIGAWLIYQYQNKDVIEKNDFENMFQKAIVASGMSFILSHFGPIDDGTHVGAILTGVLYGYLTCPIIQMDDKFQENGQQERIGLVSRYADPCKSFLVFSLCVAVLSSLFLIAEPPIDYNNFL